MKVCISKCKLKDHDQIRLNTTRVEAVGRRHGMATCRRMKQTRRERVGERSCAILPQRELNCRSRSVTMLTVVKMVHFNNGHWRRVNPPTYLPIPGPMAVLAVDSGFLLRNSPLYNAHDHHHTAVYPVPGTMECHDQPSHAVSLHCGIPYGIRPDHIHDGLCLFPHLGRMGHIPRVGNVDLRRSSEHCHHPAHPVPAHEG